MYKGFDSQYPRRFDIKETSACRSAYKEGLDDKSSWRKDLDFGNAEIVLDVPKVFSYHFGMTYGILTILVHPGIETSEIDASDFLMFCFVGELTRIGASPEEILSRIQSLY